MTCCALRSAGASALAVLALLAALSCREAEETAPTPSSGATAEERSTLPGPAPVASTPEAALPEVLRLEPALVELGVLDPTQKQEFEVVLQNLGDRLIFLRSVLTDCKCLEFDFDSPRLEPRGSLTLHGRMRGKVGIAKVRFTVASSCREQPTISGLVTMTSKPSLRVDPKKVDLEDSRRGTPSEQELVVRYLTPRGGPPFALAPVVGIDAPLTCEEVEHTVSPSGDVDDEHVHRYRLRLDTTEPRARVEGHLLFRGEGFESVQIPIEVCVHEGFRCDISSLHLGVIEAGGHRTRTVRLHTFAEGPVTVVATSSDLPGLTAKAEVVPDKELVLVELDYAATEAGEHSGTLHVELDCASVPFELPISVRVR